LGTGGSIEVTPVAGVFWIARPLLSFLQVGNP
jgi:hypothetical protein